MEKNDKCINLWNLNQFPHLRLLLCTNPNSKSWVLSTSAPKSTNNYVVIGFYPFPEGRFVWVWGHFPHPDGNAADGAWRKQKSCWFLGLQMKWEEGWWRCYLGGGKRIDDNGMHTWEWSGSFHLCWVISSFVLCFVIFYITGLLQSFFANNSMLLPIWGMEIWKLVDHGPTCQSPIMLSK